MRQITQREWKIVAIVAMVAFLIASGVFVAFMLAPREPEKTAEIKEGLGELLELPEPEAVVKPEPAPAVETPVFRPKKVAEKKSDPEVWELQKSLKAMGCDPGPIDGIMGRKTKLAMKCYQALQLTSQRNQETLVAEMNRLDAEVQRLQEEAAMAALKTEPEPAVEIEIEASVVETPKSVVETPKTVDVPDFLKNVEWFSTSLNTDAMVGKLDNRMVFAIPLIDAEEAAYPAAAWRAGDSKVAFSWGPRASDWTMRKAGASYVEVHRVDFNKAYILMIYENPGNYKQMILKAIPYASVPKSKRAPNGTDYIARLSEISMENRKHEDFNAALVDFQTKTWRSASHITWPHPYKPKDEGEPMFITAETETETPEY